MTVKTSVFDYDLTVEETAHQRFYFELGYWHAELGAEKGYQEYWYLLGYNDRLYEKEIGTPFDLEFLALEDEFF